MHTPGYPEWGESWYAAIWAPDEFGEGRWIDSGWGRAINELDTGGSPTSVAFRINDSGTILGATIGGYTLWFDGLPVLINTLLPPNTSWQFQTVSDLNNTNQICGYGSHDAEYVAAFYMVPVFPTLDLADPFPGHAGQVNQIEIRELEPGEILIQATSPKNCTISNLVVFQFE